MGKFPVVLSVMILGLLVGCGPKERPRYHLAGQITFQGKPLPRGTILIDPDIAHGHDGPQGFAEVENGTFDTRLNGRGHCGGKVVLRITGGDGTKTTDSEAVYGNPLFTEIAVPLELPTKDTEGYTITLPVSQ